jgi:hypothetical protein
VPERVSARQNQAVPVHWGLYCPKVTGSSNASEDSGAMGSSTGLYRTLTADIGFKSARLKDTFKVVRFSKARQWFREHDVNEDVDPIAALEIVHHIQTQLIGRDVFVTQRGNLVLGPRDAQYGDMVCVLFGGDVPFVLGPESEKFRLLGECDVHGIMDGEAMDMVGKEAYEDLILL